MKHDWQQLVKMSGSRSLIVEKVYIPDLDIHIEGEFVIPEFMTLNADDQIFTAGFIKSGGSIKEMEKMFGISYPTVKNRLKKISSVLGGMDIKTEWKQPVMSVLDLLEKGEISVDEAMEELK